MHFVWLFAAVGMFLFEFAKVKYDIISYKMLILRILNKYCKKAWNTFAKKYQWHFNYLNKCKTVHKNECMERKTHFTFVKYRSCENTIFREISQFLINSVTLP